MDIITHPLVAGLAGYQPAASSFADDAAGILATRVDNDSWLFLLWPDAYGRYHRVFTHCLPGLIFWTFFSAALVQAVACVKKWRCFGWFLTPNLPQSEIPPRASWRLLIAVSAGAVAFHWLLDIPSDFGNLELLYPWSDKEFSLGIVASFDWVIFGATLVCISHREFSAQKARVVYVSRLVRARVRYLASLSHGPPRGVAFAHEAAALARRARCIAGRMPRLGFSAFKFGLFFVHRSFKISGDWGR